MVGLPGSKNNDEALVLNKKDNSAKDVKPHDSKHARPSEPQQEKTLHKKKTPENDKCRMS